MNRPMGVILRPPLRLRFAKLEIIAALERLLPYFPKKR